MGPADDQSHPGRRRPERTTLALRVRALFLGLVVLFGLDAAAAAVAASDASAAHAELDERLRPAAGGQGAHPGLPRPGDGSAGLCHHRRRALPRTLRRRPGRGFTGDLILGRGHERAIETLAERTRYLILLDLVGGFDADQVCTALLRRLGPLRRSLTWDQGSELAAHQRFTGASGIAVYFCHARSPWQRGTRRTPTACSGSTSPRASTSAVTTSRLHHVAHELNARPRRTLGWLTPAQRFDQLVR